MSENTPTGTSLGRMLLIAVLAIATLGFGAASLCGAAFTLMALPDLNTSGSYSGAALVIALPSLLIGGLLAWFCLRTLMRLSRRSASDDSNSTGS